MDVDKVRLSIIKILPKDIDKDEVYPETTLEELRLNDISLKRYGWFMYRMYCIFGFHLSNEEVLECDTIYDLSKAIVSIKESLREKVGY